MRCTLPPLRVDFIIGATLFVCISTAALCIILYEPVHMAAPHELRIPLMLSLAATTRGRLPAVVSERAEWGKAPYGDNDPSSVAETRDTWMMTPAGMRSLCEIRNARSWVRHNVFGHPLLGIQQLLSTDPPHWAAFDSMGPVLPHACDSIGPMCVLGSGDEEKRICWPLDVLKSPGCVVFSIGSNNQWTFEEDVSAKTTCMVHTFDCTVKNPTPPPTRVAFHPTCVGSSCGLTPLMELVERHGVPYYLKFDAEGYEFETLATFLYYAYARYHESGGTVDMFPTQIGLEVHYTTPFFDVSQQGLLAFSNMLFHLGGYVIAHRRDNRLGYGGSEFLFVRIKGA